MERQKGNERTAFTIRTYVSKVTSAYHSPIKGLSQTRDALLAIVKRMAAPRPRINENW